MPKVWDVVVVGAGPAGSSAALAAASAGADVLLLDKSQFPRYKTCGGGLIGASLRSIPDTVRHTIEQTPMVARFSRKGKPSLERIETKPFVSMVRRSRFDQALVDHAIGAGATFQSGTRVSGLSQQNHDTV